MKEIGESTDMMNDLQKAKTAIENRKMSFSEMSKVTGISVARLKSYSSNSKQLETAKLTSVNSLARVFEEQFKLDEWLNQNIPNDYYGKWVKEAIVNGKNVYYEVIKDLGEKND